MKPTEIETKFDTLSLEFGLNKKKPSKFMASAWFRIVTSGTNLTQITSGLLLVFWRVFDLF
jgi:hypothetical protein